MGLFDTFRQGFWMQPGRPPASPEHTQSRPLPVTSRARVSHNDESGIVPFSVTLPPAHDTYDYWRIDLTNPDDLAALPADQIQKIMARVSPEIAKAWWDFVIFVGNMTGIKAMRPGTNEVDARAQMVLDTFIGVLDEEHDSAINVIHRIISGGFMRGAFAAELVLDENGRLPIDLATPDPGSFRFRQINDSTRGQVWEMGQYQNGRWVSFRDMPTVKYVPIVPETGTPYAVSWMEAAIFPGLFLIMLLQDVRRVVANFGYPREDITIDLERMRTSMPVDVQGDPHKQRSWINDTIAEIQDVINDMQPGDAWVHTDVAMRQELKGAMGGSGANMATQVDQMIQSLERMLIRGLKTIPFLMASRQSTTERQSDKEWQAYALSIDTVQDKLEYLLNNLLGQALQAQGIQANVVVGFDDLGEYDPLHKAQAEEVAIRNAIAKRNEGWISNDEASEMITGSPAVGLPVAIMGNDSNLLVQELIRARMALVTAVTQGTNGYHRNELDMLKGFVQ